MGFIVVAKNKQQIFFWTELAAASVQVALGWICIGYFGLAGAGMSFFGLYVWHSLLIYWIVRRLSGFRWSAANRKLNLIFLPLIGLVFCGFYLLPFWLATAAGALAALWSGIYSMRTLLKLAPVVRLPIKVRKGLALIGVMPPCE